MTKQEIINQINSVIRDKTEPNSITPEMVSEVLTNIVNTLEEGPKGEIEGVLTPQMFGAVADGTTNDSPAIQAMFDSIQSDDVNYSVFFPAADYFIGEQVNLPKTSGTRFLSIIGYGATLKTSEPDITIFSRMPENQAEAMGVVSGTIPVIKGFTFEGNQQTGQIGIHLGATYSASVEDCSFESLEYGAVGTFCLNSRWKGLRFVNITKFPITLQSAGSDYYGNPVWSDGSLSNSASNVSIIDSCRVFGHTDQIASFTILASDAVSFINNISEGNSRGYDLYYDRQGSTTNMNFKASNFHCEAWFSKGNIRLNGAAGIIIIEGLRRSGPAPIMDYSNSRCLIKLGISYFSNLPEDEPAFKGGRMAGGAIEINATTAEQLFNPLIWEGGILPYALTINGFLPQNSGSVTKFSNRHVFQGPEDVYSGLIISDTNLWFSPDNTYRIGRRASNNAFYRPRAIYVGDEGIHLKDKDNSSVVLAGGGALGLSELAQEVMSLVSTEYVPKPISGGEFTGVLDLTHQGKIYYDDYTEGEPLTLSIGENPQMGSFATVRISAPLTASIPDNWSFRGDALSQDSSQINEISVLYVSPDDIRIYNHVVQLPRPFIFTVDTTKSSVLTDDNQFIINTDSNYQYNYTVKTEGQVFRNVTGNLTITYPQPGIYDIEITGQYPKPYFRAYHFPDSKCLIEVKQWGNIKWESFSESFREITDFKITATDIPDMTIVEDLSHMFEDGINVEFNESISNWDVSNIKNMSYLFSSTKNFNISINNWDVSKVINMNGMFWGSSYNQPLDNWDVSNVIGMDMMFSSSEFNQDISNWDVSKVESMDRMFLYTKFTQDISDWNISKVGDFYNFLTYPNEEKLYPYLDEVYNKWSQLPLQENVDFTINGYYTEGSMNNRQLIIDNFNWEITGDELEV